MDILNVKKINKSFDKVRILKDISFKVKKGEVLSIIGPSGSGKSTLLRCLTQLEIIDSGQIDICSECLVRNDENGNAVYITKENRAKIGLHVGLVFQNFNLFPHLSVIDNLIKAPVTVLGVKEEIAKDAATKLLKKMNLENRSDYYPYQLSGGQKQRVSIARALAMNPDILFFDEPTSSLDPELTGEILKIIRELSEEKITMVIVTHEMDFARDVSDKVIFMDKGEIIAIGTPSQIFEDTENERIRSFLL